MQSTYALDPAQPVLLDLTRAKRRTAALIASCAFRIGQVRYAASYPHAIPRGEVVVQALGTTPGTLSVDYS